MTDTEPIAGKDFLLNDEQRIMAVKGALDQALELAPPDNSLKLFMLERLKSNIDDAILRAGKNKRDKAYVVQFSDAIMHNPSDAELISSFFEAFDVHLPTESGNIEANSVTVSQISKRQDIPEVALGEKETFWEARDRFPAGAFRVVENGYTSALVLPTKINGVRIAMYGTAITHPNQELRYLNPQIIIDLDEVPQYNGELEQNEPVRSTWSEVHKREPGESNTLSIRERAAGDRFSNDDRTREVAEAFLQWKPSAKPGPEIIVTPAALKENPVLDTKEKQIETVRKAVHMALEHQKLSREEKVPSVIGNTAWSLTIMLEILKMSPQEITKDSEALADLAEYLLQAASSTDNIKGPSSILPKPKEGNLLAEVAYKIKDTWNLEEDLALSQPHMYKRVNWS